MNSGGGSNAARQTPRLFQSGWQCSPRGPEPGGGNPDVSAVPAILDIALIRDNTSAAAARSVRCGRQACNNDPGIAYAEQLLPEFDACVACTRGCRGIGHGNVPDPSVLEALQVPRTLPDKVTRNRIDALAWTYDHRRFQVD